MVKNMLPTQGTRIQSLIWEEPTCRGATETVHHTVTTAEPLLWKPGAVTAGSTQPAARAQKSRSPREEKPARHSGRAALPGAKE